MSQSPNRKLKAKIIEIYGTQVDSARLINWTEDRVSRLIHGRLSPRDSDRQLIARKLGVPQDEIFPS